MLGTLLARRLRKRNENLAHNGNIWLGVGIEPAICLLEQLPNLPEKTVVVLTDDVYIGGANPSPPKDWWDNLVPFDAVIVTSATSPEEFHTQGGLPPLEDLQEDPTVAFCTPTRCALGVIEWLQNGEEKKLQRPRLCWLRN